MKPILGIIANTLKPRVAIELPPLVKWLEKREIDFVLANDLLPLLPSRAKNVLPLDQLVAHSDIILSFGGDGTFLKTAQVVGAAQVPIVGVNLGGFGYLADVRIQDIRERVEDILANRYTVQKRNQLEVTIGQGDNAEKYRALNDIVVDKGGYPRTIVLEILLDGHFLNAFKADGLILATATGSTGYSLSVGGPILEPCAEGMIINPISPHMLANRPLVVCPERSITVSALSERGDYQVAVDGQILKTVPSGSSVNVKRADVATSMVVFSDYDFYRLLRDKLHWRYQAEM